MRNKKTKILSLMVATTACLAAAALTFDAKVADAASEATFHELGASVRMSQDKGIRFAFGLPEDKTGDGYEIGTLIVPKEVLGESELNHNSDTADSEEVDYVNIPCTKKWVSHEDLDNAKDGYNYYNAALTEIPSVNYDTVLVARSYYVKDGVYTYSDPVERSIGYVASAALNNGEADKDGVLSMFAAGGYGETAITVDGDNFITVSETTTITASNEKGYLPVWSSSNENVATVDKTGKVTPVKGGEATITATIGNVSESKVVYIVGDGLYEDQIGIRINGWNMSSNVDYLAIATGENGEMVATAKFQANATYAPALVLRNIQSKAYYEALVANGYTKFAFNLAVEGDVSELYVFGKAINTFPVNNGVYTINLDTQHFVTYYDTMYTIATSGSQVGQASSISAKFITWKSPANEWNATRDYIFTISNVVFTAAPTLEVAAETAELGYDETTTIRATTNWPASFVVWSTSDATIATVENGMVTVVGQKWGDVTITATVGSVSVDTTITVNGPTQLTVDFAGDSNDLVQVGKSTTLNATTDWNVNAIEWTSSDEAIATVIGGVVKGVKGGEVTITAKLGELSESKTVYVVGGLNSDQIGLRNNGYQQQHIASSFNMAVGENGTMTITAKFSDSAAYYPMLMLRNMNGKAYYQKLVDNGYVKLTFMLGVGGDNAADVSDLYVFGKKLTSFPKGTDGAYAVTVDVQHIVTYYDNIYGIATSGGQAGQSGSLDKMFIAWKSPLTWAGSRNYVFTISNMGYRQGVLFSDNIGMRVNGWNMTTNTMYMTMDIGTEGEMIITANWQAYTNYGPALVLKNLQEKAYYQGLIDNGYTYLTFDLKVGGTDGDKLSDVHILGSAQKIAECTQENGVYKVKIQLAHIVQFYDTITTLDTSASQAGQWGSRSALLLAWRFSTNFATVPTQATRNYVFTISNTAYSK